MHYLVQCRPNLLTAPRCHCVIGCVATQVEKVNRKKEIFFDFFDNNTYTCIHKINFYTTLTCSNFTQTLLQCLLSPNLFQIKYLFDTNSTVVLMDALVLGCTAMPYRSTFVPLKVYPTIRKFNSA